MPRDDPRHWSTEGIPTLEMLARRGINLLIFHCLDRSCCWQFQVTMAKLMLKAPPELDMKTLSARARCRRCGKRGAYVHAMKWGP